MCDTGIDTYYELTPNKRRKGFRGIGLVIVNSFENDPELKRTGTKEELQRLTRLFDSFNLEVRRHTELTKDEIVKVLEETAKDPKLSSDSMIAIAISSHGCKKGLLGINMEERMKHRNDPNYKNNDDCIPPTQIQGIFNGESCKSLVGKPKLFLLNGCRGTGVENIVQMEGEEEKEAFGHDGPKPNEESIATTWSDFFVIHSCVPGNISIRSSKVGSLFLTEFSEAYAKYGSKYPIESIMPTVNRNLIIVCKRKDTPSKQSCTWESTCTRSLHIQPKDLDFDSGKHAMPANHPSTSKGLPPLKGSIYSPGDQNDPRTKGLLSNGPKSSSNEQIPDSLLPLDHEQFHPTSCSSQQGFINPTSFPGHQDFRNPTPHPGSQDLRNPTYNSSQQAFIDTTSYSSHQDFRNPTSHPGSQDLRNPTYNSSQQAFINPTSYSSHQDFRNRTPHPGSQEFRNPTYNSSQQAFIDQTSYPSPQDFRIPTPHSGHLDFRIPTPHSGHLDFRNPTPHSGAQDLRNQMFYPHQQDFRYPTPNSSQQAFSNQRSYPGQHAFSKPKSSPMPCISGLVVDKSGQIYVTDSTNESIWTFPNDMNAKVLDKHSNKFSIPNELAGSRGICIKGHLLFVTCNDRILKLCSRSGELLQSQSVNTSLTGLDIDDVGSIYICEQFTCSIMVLDTDFNFARNKLNLSGINNKKARLLDIKVFPSEIYVLISGTDSAIQMFSKNDGIFIMFIVSSAFLSESYFFTMDRDNKNIFAGDSTTNELKAFNDEGKLIWRKNAFGEIRESGTIMGIGMNSNNEVVIACICNTKCMIRRFPS